MKVTIIVEHEIRDFRRETSYENPKVYAHRLVYKELDKRLEELLDLIDTINDPVID